MTKDHHFRSECEIVMIVRFWAHFWSPKCPKPLFFALGPTLPFWSVLGAKSAPEAKNDLTSTFCSPKWEIAFLRFWRKWVKITIFIFDMTPCFYVRKEWFVIVVLLRTTTLQQRSTFHPERQTVENINIWARIWSKNRPRSIVALLAAKTTKSTQNAFEVQKCAILQILCFGSGGVHLAPMAPTLL